MSTIQPIKCRREWVMRENLIATQGHTPLEVFHFMHARGFDEAQVKRKLTHYRFPQ